MNALDNYGTIKVGRYYKIVAAGRDYYKVSCGGTLVHVPDYVFNKEGD